MNIAERLDQLMQIRGINRNQLSKAANIPYTTLDGISKRGCDNVKLSTLIKLADYFDVSIDYLVGRSSVDEFDMMEYHELRSFVRYLEWRHQYG